METPQGEDVWKSVADGLSGHRLQARVGSKTVGLEGKEYGPDSDTSPSDRDIKIFAETVVGLRDQGGD